MRSEELKAEREREQQKQSCAPIWTLSWRRSRTRWCGEAGAYNNYCAGVTTTEFTKSSCNSVEVLVLVGQEAGGGFVEGVAAMAFKSIMLSIT